ncbi:GNAT family N-acetyltransferase [Jannaschia sp. W003]|uniref:GNAT family N-acetyltransferase n=1 Tax=Jannaschia sp. W003 TaxID=2867012 RepID=UPI0021A74155|nr:GNAT family N-acetyltransferase [Jannaschia sp. W003]UWQ20590.1 GNAT family N-acetyltransferase [Jannaschia sp. W003]
MLPHAPHVASGPEIAAAAALRRAVFVDELGADAGAEADRFDAEAEHMVLRGEGGAVIATLRLAEGARYTAGEFDISKLERSGRRMGELGRMCVAPAYRGGAGAVALLAAAVERLRARGVELVVGTGSLPGADPEAHMPALRALRAAALAPDALRPRARGPEAVTVGEGGRPGDMRRVPPILKSYLRAGAWVGEGAWVDRAMDCVDVCLVLDLARLRPPAALRRLAERPR